jgi:gas vesicle protein
MPVGRLVRSEGAVVPDVWSRLPSRPAAAREFASTSSAPCWNEACFLDPEVAVGGGHQPWGSAMRYAHESDGARVALAMLAGAAIGAGVALLYAPKAGAALRGDLGQSMGHLQDAVSARYQRLSERATAALEHAHDTAGRAVAAVEQGKRAFSHRARAAVTAPFERIDASEPF